MPGSLLIKLHFSAQKLVLIKVAQQQIGIGYTGVGPSDPVTDRSGFRSRAFRSNLERSHPTDLRNAPTSCSNLHQVDDRHLNGETTSFHKSLNPANLKGGYDTGHPFLDEAGLGRGSSHVEAANFRDIEEFPVILPPDA